MVGKEVEREKVVVVAKVVLMVEEVKVMVVGEVVQMEEVVTEVLVDGEANMETGEGMEEVVGLEEMKEEV